MSDSFNKKIKIILEKALSRATRLLIVHNEKLDKYISNNKREAENIDKFILDIEELLDELNNETYEATPKDEKLTIPQVSCEICQAKNSPDNIVRKMELAVIVEIIQHGESQEKWLEYLCEECIKST